MKSKNLLNLKNNVLHTVMLPLMVVLLVLGATSNVSAQKYELSGKKSQITQATEITLNGSAVNKFYYLFRVDNADAIHYVTLMIGQGFELQYAPQQTEGKYVVYEFSEFKGMPFDIDKYKPTDGIKQTGEVTITAGNN